MKWSLLNWESWKRAEAKRESGIRLVHSRKTLNDVTPSEWDSLRNLDGTARAEEFIRRHMKRKPDDPEAA